MFWFALATKMVVAALFVSVATIVAERVGAMVGALVATLPVSAGPVYVFLALVAEGCWALCPTTGSGLRSAFICLWALRAAPFALTGAHVGAERAD
jgi:Ca2+/H+ antiporter